MPRSAHAGSARLAAVTALSAVRLKRLGRDRIGLFFILVLPFLIILLFGGQGGTQVLPVGLVVQDGGPAAQRLADRLQAADTLAVTAYADDAELREAVRRGAETGGIVVPADYDDTLAGGGTAAVTVVAEPGSGLPGALLAAAGPPVEAENARLAAARFASARTGIDEERALAIAEQVEPGTALSVDTEILEAAVDEIPPADQTAATRNLVLFVFITSLVAGAELVESRRLGVTRRTFAAPVTAGTILLGETAGRFLIAALQAVIVIAGASVLFGASWGTWPVGPLLVALVVLLFALVGTGAALLFGSLLSDPEQAIAVAPFLGIGLGMLGGTTWPLEIVPPVMQALGRATPHSWAVDALEKVVVRGQDLAGIWVDLAVLATFAAALLALAAWSLRRTLLRGS